MKTELICYLLAIFAAYGFGFYSSYVTVKPEIQIEVQERIVTRIVEHPIETVVYRYPNTPPYQKLSDPINYEQALVLLNGMRASHVQILSWSFEKDPGFGIGDRDFQERCIKWYDSLIEFVQRQESGRR